MYNKIEEDTIRMHLDSVFIFSLVWSIGCTGGTMQSRNDFNDLLRAAVADKLVDFCGPSGEMWVSYTIQLRV